MKLYSDLGKGPWGGQGGPGGARPSTPLFWVKIKKELQKGEKTGQATKTWTLTLAQDLYPSLILIMWQLLRGSTVCTASL